ncbi:MAG: class I SAM-dependent methyltransferase [Gemmataceae bacterium]
MLPHVYACRRALVLGDGNGRFLVELLAANPQLEVDALDISTAMTELARRRIGNSPRVQFHIGDALHQPFSTASYDLVVTNFFLDCFEQADLDVLLPRLAASLVPRGVWIVGDFRLPNSSWSRFPARVALATMYAAFGIVTRLPARRLVDPDSWMLKCGLKLGEEQTRLNGFLTARLWVKDPMQQPFLF